MSRSKIEWCDYTINPVKGLCPVACSYCYARRMYRRFKWNPEIRFDVQPLLDVKKIKDPSRIFVGSTMELFGEWVDAFWLDSILATVRDYPQHTFIFLTKQPWKAKPYQFPDNAWLGTSVAEMKHYGSIQILNEVKVKHRFVSFEPLLDFTPPDLRGMDWIIIGQQTPIKKATTPQRAWVEGIETAAGALGIPVFEKNNLAGLFPYRPLRQELPA